MFIQSHSLAVFTDKAPGEFTSHKFFPITEFALSAALNRKITHANVKSCYQEPEYETKDGAAI